MAELSRGFAAALKADWHTLARPNQLPPPGDFWRIWLVLAGRGFGKTRTGAEWVRAQAESATAGRIALVSATASDCRDVLIEGESGILAISPRGSRPNYEPTKRRLTWPNGAIATAYSADEAERLRGPQHDAAWCDELAAWRYPESWDMLMMGLRLGKNPRCVVTTTPKGTKLVRELVAREGRDVVITRGKTSENAANLAPQFIETIVSRYSGTRLGRQELDGELLTDTPGALWSLSMLEATRVAAAPALQRIVVGVDPSGGGGENADECGIIVAALGLDGHGYVLGDLSGVMAPPDWARKAVSAYWGHQADRVVAEINYGGAMVTATIAAVDPTVPVKTITSSRGKVLRAEPIAAFFEQGRAHLVGSHPALEDQLTSFTADYNRSRDGSPDRADALVFALTELMLGLPLGGYFREAALLEKDDPVELPRRINYVFAAGAVSMGEQPRVGVIFCATSPSLGGNTVPLTILDWELKDIDGNLFEVWLPTVFERLKTFEKSCTIPGMPGNAGLWLESAGAGGAILQAGEKHGRVQNLDEILDLPKDMAERVPLVEARLHAGRDVKIARPAFERLQAHQGTTRNHFLAQVMGYKPGATGIDTTLLNALCLALLISGPSEK